ncbi:MAG: peptidoglycan DD-metalloendopeptidase family protein [Bacillota bacterium]
MLIRTSQGWKGKGFLGALVILITFGALAFASGSHQAFNIAYAVVIDGEEIGLVQDQAEVHMALGEIEKCAAAECGLEVELASAPVIQCRHLSEDESAQAAFLSAEELRDRLSENVILTAPAVAIIVDGVTAVGVPDEKTAANVIAEIQNDYKEELQSQGRVQVQDLTIAEQIDFQPMTLTADLIKNEEEAKQVLLRGTDRVIVHKVERGESLWSIASKNEMSVSDLRRANPELKGDMIKVGQSLNMIVPDPYINLLSEEERVVTQAIPFRTQVIEDSSLWPWQRVVKQPGSHGKEEITLLITRCNGEETARRVLHRTTITEPVTQVVLQGRKQIPDRGTGQLIWPMQGQLTCGFGWSRYRYHHGIDIAAPIGTPIKAADSGTVVFAGWAGALGNTVRIDHGGGKMETVYSHCNAFRVKVGDVVEKGQVIATCGNNGNSTGPHLHFEVRVNGTAVNPIQYYPAQ